LAKVCSQCGVPTLIRSLCWESNGVISLLAAPGSRQVFYESDIIDSLFSGIEDIIGASIRHIVIESRRREIRAFVEKAFADQIRTIQERRKYQKSQQIKEVFKDFNITMNEIGVVYGYGRTRLSERWETGDDYAWRYQIVENPYSKYLYAAGVLGANEALSQQDLKVDYTEIADKVWEVTCRPGKHSLALGERLKRKSYPFKPGEIEYDCCPECGLPLELGGYRWEFEEGIIIDRLTGRRMAIMGPEDVDSVLDDLVSELGESLQEAIIEALRRQMKESMQGEYWNQKAPAFNRMIALRGLGNLVRFDGDSDSLSLKIENACMPLLMVGTVRGLFELVMRKESSTCEWNMADDGDLDIMVRS
jgi:hypothetical protein